MSIQRYLLLLLKETCFLADHVFSLSPKCTSSYLFWAFCMFFSLVWDENVHSYHAIVFLLTEPQFQLKPTPFTGISVTPVFHLDFYLLLSEGIDSRQYSFWPLAIYGCVQSGNKQLCVCILPLLIITKFLESKYFVLFMFHQYVLICITSTQ